MGMREEEAKHLPGGIGPLWIGVGPGCAAARPSMAGAVDDPLLEHGLPLGIGMQRPAVGPPAATWPCWTVAVACRAVAEAPRAWAMT